MENKEEKKKKIPINDAERVAKIMVDNMIANMADPNFEEERERRLQDARDRVLENRKNRKSNKDDS
ncbi:MAG: hypothetical protein KGD63_02840 [Candidatus Lokiarchaeota archaeon]|nr:hypothetical protein [Candidatus Lokiarchaeota archaeon]